MNQITIEFMWKTCLFFCVVGLIMISSEAAFAVTSAAGVTGSDDLIGNTLCRIVNTLQGNAAKAIAMIAIFVVGMGMFMGKFQWGTALATAGGVAIIFASGKIIAWITGDSTNSGCGTT